jgi:hypothetical protein
LETTIRAYSLLIITTLLLVIVAVILFRKKPRLREVLAFALIAFGLAVAYFSIRPTQTMLMGDAANVQAMIGQGTPVILEFQSPY